MRKFMALVSLLTLLAPEWGWSQAQPGKTKASRAKEPVVASAPREAAAPKANERPAAAESTAAKLPIRRVVLYKNGVGYFDHLGRVRGNQDVSIDFTSGQLNDVLKSLTILDLGHGHITGVSYNSEAPLGRRLGLLRLPLGEKPSVAEFLGALRGARLEVHSGAGPVTGRLLSVEKKTRTTKSEERVETDEISLVTDSGEVRTVELGPATSVRIAERDLNQEVSRYLGLVASAREKDLRRMTITTAGAGERQLYVSYISEVPIWKTTYRVVLPSKPDGKPLLQGWAIVDNTVGEDWSNVELSLVAGAPQSFIQQLSQPYYGRRAVVPLPESAQLTPQTHAATLEEKEAGGVPGGQVGGVIGGVGARSFQAGVGAGVGGGVGTPKAAPTPRDRVQMLSNASIEGARESLEAAAQGKELGDLFEYKLKEPVTIRKNQSALVPIVQAEIGAEKVSLWNESSHSPRPLRALWLTNSSALTLDGGSFNVLEDETFAGEGLLESIKPGEKRLLSYAADLGVLVDTHLETEQQRVTRVRILRGMMRQTSELRERKTYTVRNEDASPRMVVIEHPVRAEWKLDADSPKPEETSAGLYRFRLMVDPKKTEKLVVKETRPLVTTYQLSTVTDDQIELFLQQKTINADIEQALRKIVAQKDEAAKFQAQIDQRQKEINRIFEDQQRLRENMKALKGGGEEKALTQRYTQQLADQETRLDTLRREMTDLEAKRQRVQNELSEMLQQLSLDVNL
jgi:hypothetical protein